uniref:Uncharacterized protein n=1 Tax=Arion vulgaris TaxID=1028688 RepID=A0A0B6ZYU0_9EUPU
MPHVVFMFNMILKGNRPIVKSGSVQPTDKTSVSQDLIFGLFLTPEVSKSVDDDTKDEVEYNNNDNEEEEQIIDNSSQK